MRYSIQEIATALGAEAAGDLELVVTGAAEPALARAEDLALAMSPKFAEGLGRGAARAAILWPGADWQALGLQAAIFTPRPRMAMAGVAAMLDRGQGRWQGVHPSAVIDAGAVLGAGVSVGPLAVICAGAVIGDGTVIGAQCFVGEGARIGANGFLRELVSIGARVTVGDRVILQPGVRLGGDGFSFVTPEVSGVEKARHSLGDQGEIRPQSWVRIASLGAVTVGDDVEMGANTTVDNGNVRDTVIGDGCKMDSQVHIGHNVRTGRDCLFAAQTGIAGSVVVGNNVVLGGQVGVGDNLTIGDNVIAGGGTKILSNVPAGRVMMGYPAVKMDLHTEIYKAQRRLPRFLQDLDALKKAVFKSSDSQ